MNFAKNLETLRKDKALTLEKGLSQNKLAIELGLTRSMIASYEQGVAEPSLCNLVKIAKYFEVKTDTLLLTRK